MQMACGRCGGEARLAAEIKPLGQQAGMRAFQCLGCGHMNWSKLEPSATAEPQAQQQQQPQPNKPKEE
jgi:hypothetical protein